MDIKSFGCSFIFGSELSDQVNLTPSQQTWPALLAKHTKSNYECHARPGSGNLQIAEQVLTQLAKTGSGFYIIGWTWIDRFDYVDSNNDQWRTIMPVDSDSVARCYYRDLHSQYRDKLTSLMCIKTVIDTLVQKNCAFIMTYMDSLLFETQWHCTPAMTDLQKFVRPHMVTFEGMSFLEWSRKNHFAETTNWHPLESAHTAASDLLIKSGILSDKTGFFKQETTVSTAKY